MFNLATAVAKVPHGREWAPNYPSEVMRGFCGDIIRYFF